MAIPGIAPSATDIAISGMRANAMRSKVIAENIANANTTRSADGEPYRRHMVVLQAGAGLDPASVSVGDVVDDMSSPFSTILSPGHPDADAEGYVRYPNVSLPREMMDMVAASRAYQANAAVMKRQMDLNNATLELLR